MFQKNQQLNECFDKANIQQLVSLGIAQSDLIKLLITLNKLKFNCSNLFDLINTAVIRQLIFINKVFINNILLIQLMIKYFTPFTINLILHVGTSLIASAWVIHSKARQDMIQSKPK